MSAADEEPTKARRGATMIPNAVYDDPNLEIYEFAVLSAIWTFDWDEKGDGCLASIDTIARVARCSESKAQVCKAWLRDHGYIKVEVRTDSAGRRQSDRIRIAKPIRTKRDGGTPHTVDPAPHVVDPTPHTVDPHPPHGGPLTPHTVDPYPPQRGPKEYSGEKDSLNKTQTKNSSANPKPRASATPSTIASGTTTGYGNEERNDDDYRVDIGGSFVEYVTRDFDSGEETMRELVEVDRF